MREKKISVSNFKARCLKFMDQVSRSGEPLLVTKRGRPLVRVSPAQGRISESDYELEGTCSLQTDIISPLGGSIWEASSFPEVSRPARGRKRT